MSQGCKWCFTIFRDEVGSSFEPDLHEYMATLDSPVWGVYGGAQLERTPSTGILHIQGFVVFSKNKRLVAVKKLNATAHWEVMGGTVEQSEAYCWKVPGVNSEWDAKGTREPDTEPRVWGVRPTNQQGKRNDLIAACDVLVAATGDVDDRMRAVAAMAPHVIAKYGGGMERLARLTDKDDYVFPEPVWRPWQQELKTKLLLPANDRHIEVFVDPAGGAGKSTVMRYFVTNPEFRACTLSGQVRDMAHAFSKKKYRIVFFDVARTQAEHVDHLMSFAETLKNGVIFSAKYDSGQYSFRPPHVVFFTNSELDLSKWTVDRPQVVRLSEPGTFYSHSVASASGGHSNATMGVPDVPVEGTLFPPQPSYLSQTVGDILAQPLPHDSFSYSQFSMIEDEM